MNKFKSKAQMMWEISKEQEVDFRQSLPKNYNKLELDELFKLIRGAEYRRGKEDGISRKNIICELSPCSKCNCMTKSIREGRAKYRCGKCKADKSLSDVYFYEATHNRAKEEGDETK